MSPKKKALIVLGTLVVIAAVTVLIFALSLGTIIKSSLETQMPRMTQSPVQLASVTIRPLTGSGSIEGLVIGNPDGFASEYALKVGRAKLDLDPLSLFSEKVVIQTIQLDGPEIIFEGGKKANNLVAILQNLKDHGDPGRTNKPAASDGPPRKLQVNHFRLTGARVHLRLAILGGSNITLNAPEIELHDLGTGPDGVTGYELTVAVIRTLTTRIDDMVLDALAEIGRDSMTNTMRRDSGATPGPATNGLPALTERLPSPLNQK